MMTIASTNNMVAFYNNNKNDRYSLYTTSCRFHSIRVAAIWNSGVIVFLLIVVVVVVVVLYPLLLPFIIQLSSISSTGSICMVRIDALTIIPFTSSYHYHHHYHHIQQQQQQQRPFIIWTRPRQRIMIPPSVSRRNVIPSQQRRSVRIDMTSSSSSSSSSSVTTMAMTTTTTSTTGTTTTGSTNNNMKNSKIISDDALQLLQHQRYVIIPNFIDIQLQNELRNDIQTLRNKKKKTKYFQQANIGQDNTNTYNSSIRITETCFIGKNKYRFNMMERNPARETLYKMIDDIGAAITSSSSSSSKSVLLDDSLTELLYAYYPNGGYYRTHMDAIPNSISYLRQYSFLLYLNGGVTTSTTNHNSSNHDNLIRPTIHYNEWNTTIDGGQLRLYLNRNDSNSTIRNSSNASSSIDPPKRRTLDFTNDEYKKEYDTILDVTPTNGTLVLFDSHIIPHEVLNTYRERYVIIGWFNRQPSLFNTNDYTNIMSPAIGNTGGDGTTGTTTTATVVSNERRTMLAVAVGMITFGVYNLVNTL